MLRRLWVIPFTDICFVGVLYLAPVATEVEAKSTVSDDGGEVKASLESEVGTLNGAIEEQRTPLLNDHRLNVDNFANSKTKNDKSDHIQFLDENLKHESGYYLAYD